MRALQAQVVAPGGGGNPQVVVGQPVGHVDDGDAVNGAPVSMPPTVVNTNAWSSKNKGDP